jgi:Protein of unknown function (DUF3788)
MSEIKVHIMSDKQVIPTEDYIFSILGEKKNLWQGIMKHASENYKEISGSWNYYNDGKQWLFKLVQKKKTLFWASLLEVGFRITFYFGDKAEPVINDSLLPQSVKEQFKAAKKYGHIRAVTFIVNDYSDVENILKMIEIKSGLK